MSDLKPGDLVVMADEEPRYRRKWGVGVVIGRSANAKSVFRTTVLWSGTYHAIDMHPDTSLQKVSEP